MLVVELEDLMNHLPESVVVKRVEDKIFDLGNYVVCNDHVAISWPGIDPETKEMVADVLGIDTFDPEVYGNENMRTSLVLSNAGGLVGPTDYSQVLPYYKLLRLIDMPVVTGTVNGGSGLLGAHLTVNDSKAFCGSMTTEAEISVIKKALKVDDVFKFGSGTTPPPPDDPEIVIGSGLSLEHSKDPEFVFRVSDFTALEWSLVERSILALHPKHHLIINKVGF
ncbi:eukaryotic translation initiation factor 6-2 [Phtheirospermum japonicum]|uniref:Eukaryotic translation initiation factor 6-2 n=1 Tax=Phtheirospermum japonicum TaxID=374723 RepID=A0A830BSX4_9LAMI|nr:eukaryotic translation initiation factor 6-2 [Phtheirospermum japonicum]